MTRKHYVALARALFNARLDVPTYEAPEHAGAAFRALDTAIGKIADELSANPNFDRPRFVNACVTGKGV